MQERVAVSTLHYIAYFHVDMHPPKAQTPIHAQVTALHIFKAVWRAAHASGRAEGANAKRTARGVKLSGTEDRGSGKAWMSCMAILEWHSMHRLSLAFSSQRLLNERTCSW
jgi:hypothetical protein